MSSVPQTDSPSRAKSRARSIQLFPSDELADLATFSLTNEQIGVLMKLRLCCWHRGGLPNTEESLMKTRKQLLGISPRKWAKFWPILSVFFIEIDGFLFFSADESRRRESEEHISKLKEAGRKGAETRWNSSQKQAETVDGQAILPTMAPFPSLPFPSETEANTRGGAAAATVQATEATAAGPPPGLQNLSRAVSDSDYQAIATRSLELGLQAPDRITAVKILQRFPNIPPHKFPLFKGQNSPGLWLFKGQIDIELEIARQENPPKKPSSSEDPVLRQWAREIDRKAGR